MQKLLLFIVGLGAPAGVFYWLVFGFGESSRHPQEVILAAPDINFGEVWATGDFERTLHLTNASPEPLKILRFAASCSCLEIEPKSLTLPEFSTAEVRAKLNLHTAFGRASDADKFKSPFSAIIRPILDNPGISVRPWRLKGVVKRLAIVNASQLQIHDDHETNGGSKPHRLSLKLAPEVKPREISVACDQKFARVHVEPANDSDDRADVVFTLNPALESGSHSFNLEIGHDFHGFQINQPIPLKASVSPAVMVFPQVIVFPARQIGNNEHSVVRIQSCRASQFTVASFDISGEDVSVKPEKGTSDFRITVRYSNLGQQTRTVFFNISVPGNSQPLRIPCVLKYYGLGESN